MGLPGMAEREFVRVKQRGGEAVLHWAMMVPLIAIVALGVVMRAQRFRFGHPFYPVVIIGRTLLLTVLGIIWLMGERLGGLSWGSVVLGVGAGCVAAVWSLRSTRFQRRRSAVDYTVSPFGESVVIACFVLRFAMEFAHIPLLAPHFPVPRTTAWRHAFSLTVYTLFFSYWAYYYAGLWKMAREFLQAPPDPRLDP